MNKLTNLLAMVAFVFVAQTTWAQNTCCGTSTTAPEVTTGTNASVALNDNVVAPNMTVSASTDLPNVEFLVTKRNAAALDGTGAADTTGGGGDVIIGSVSSTGTFEPYRKGRYGIWLYPNDTFDLTAVGYDLSTIQTLADSLLNGTNGAPTFTPCCGLFTLMAAALQEPALAGFCDSVRNAGVNGAADINSMEDVLVIFDAFASGQVSVGSMIWTLQTINGNGNFISAQCGGTGANNFVSYGVNRTKSRSYPVTNFVTVKKLSDVALFAMFPNPAGDVVNVNFTTTESVDLSINVYNAVGVKVANRSLGTVNGNLTTTLDLQGFAAGMYMVELTDGKESKTHKLMVK